MGEHHFPEISLLAFATATAVLALVEASLHAIRSERRFAAAVAAIAHPVKPSRAACSGAGRNPGPKGHHRVKECGPC